MHIGLHKRARTRPVARAKIFASHELARVPSQYLWRQ